MAQVDVVTGARIAVLDDNRNFQNLMRTMLRHLGFRHVEVFGDPDERFDRQLGMLLDGIDPPAKGRDS